VSLLWLLLVVDEVVVVVVVLVLLKSAVCGIVSKNLLLSSSLFSILFPISVPTSVPTVSSLRRYQRIAFAAPFALTTTADVSSANATFESPYGTIRSAWSVVITLGFFSLFRSISSFFCT
jgi:hypothetical protein